MENKIICPNCNESISLGKLQNAELEKQIRKEISLEIKNKNNEIMNNEISAYKKKKDIENEIFKNDLKKKILNNSQEALNRQQNEIQMLTIQNAKLKSDYNIDLKRIEAENAKKYNEKEKLLEYQYNERKRQDKLKMERIMESYQNSSSSQILGEAGENYVVDELANFFTEDTFIEINKGENGGDWIQNVNDDQGNTVGQIYIESKNTKTYSTSWVPKFQKDMEKREITIGVLISKNFPKDRQGENSFNDRGIPVYKLDSNVFISHISLIREHIKKTYVYVQLGQLQNSDIPVKLFEYLHSDMYLNAVQQLVTNFVRHKDRIENRVKLYQKMINEDNQHLKDVIEQISKIFKDDINKIANDEVISLPKLEELKTNI